MALKDLKNYYNEVCDQYYEMLENLKDFQKDQEEGLVEEDRMEEIKQNIKPLMDNYERISYLMFLLNKPARKEKVKSYEKRNKKLLQKLSKENSLEKMRKENKEILDYTKNLK